MASSLANLLKKAKEAVDAHSNAIQNIQNRATELKEAETRYRQQTIFYMAAESLQRYLDNQAQAPVGNGQISSEVIRQNLAGAVVWDSSQTTFDENRYLDLVAAVSLIQNYGIVEQVMQEDSSFTEEEWNSYIHLETVIKQSITNLYSIYEQAAQEYNNEVEYYKSEIQTMIDTGNEGIKQLKNWKMYGETRFSRQKNCVRNVKKPFGIKVRIRRNWMKSKKKRRLRSIQTIWKI